MKKVRLKKQAQLRGEALRVRIIEAIRLLASADGNVARSPNTISSSKLAALVPCSRTTLARYDSLIQETLADLGSRLRRRTGAAREEALLDKIAFLENEKSELEAELLAVRRHHIDLYDRLMRQSVRVAALFRDDAIDASTKASCCVLCGGPPPSLDRTARAIVVPLRSE